MFEGIIYKKRENVKKIISVVFILIFETTRSSQVRRKLVVAHAFPNPFFWHEIIKVRTTAINYI